MITPRQRAASAIATWFGAGLVPKGPGTAGAAAALLLAALLEWHCRPPIWIYAACGAALIIPGAWAAGVHARVNNSKDPQEVVVDEVAGQWIALGGLSDNNSWLAWLAAFALFRFFDILKPWPVRQFEKLPGGIGILMDDVMAGIYAAVVLRLLGWNNLI